MRFPSTEAVAFGALEILGPMGASAYFHVPFGLRITLLPSCVTARICANAPVGTEARATRAMANILARSMGRSPFRRGVRPETETLGEEALDVLGGDLLGDVGWELLEEFPRLAGHAHHLLPARRDVRVAAQHEAIGVADEERAPGGVEGAPRGHVAVAEGQIGPQARVLVHERAHGLRPRGHARVRPDDLRPRL